MDNSKSRAEQSRAAYDILRVMATLLVVIGHCTYYKISTEYGGCDYSYLVMDESIVFKVVSEWTSFIYIFHMPLFIALSGALFAKSLTRGHYTSFKEVVNKKAKRLIIPFIVVTLFYAVPIKFLSGYFNESTNVFRDIFIGQFLIQGSTHLWYLLTLFLVFIVVYLWLKNINLDFTYCSIFREDILKQMGGFVFFALLSMISGKIHIYCLFYVCQYTFWFYVGMLFERHRMFFENNFFNVKKILLLDVVLYAIYKIIGHIAMTLPMMIIFKIMLCLTVYRLSYLATMSNIMNYKIFSILRRNSLGIYLYSDPVNYFILAYGVTVFGGDLWSSNLYSLGLYLVRMFFTLTISIFVTELIRKCQIKYIC